MSNKKQTALQQFLSELHLRLLRINSEPNGIVRETMIQNFLIDELDYLELEKQQIINDYCNGRISVVDKAIIPAEQYYREVYGEGAN